MIMKAIGLQTLINGHKFDYPVGKIDLKKNTKWSWNESKTIKLHQNWSVSDDFGIDQKMRLRIINQD